MSNGGTRSTVDTTDNYYKYNLDDISGIYSYSVDFQYLYLYLYILLRTHCYCTHTPPEQPSPKRKPSIHPFLSLFLSSSLLPLLLCSPQFAFDTLLFFPFFPISLACDSWLDPVSYIPLSSGFLLVSLFFRPSHLACAAK